jgi:prepilin-type N-terminal cleavage/methylation domain-containing protein/prepilin-type processing-associated H-X9-DG protein
MPMPARRSIPHGFTLVEMLIVLAIILVLLALLVPAIQRVREIANLVGCSNNYRQIGQALTHYHQAKGRFPLGCLEWRASPAQVNQRQLAWSAFLLPYLESELGTTYPHYDQPFDSPANLIIGGTPLKIYRCPSSLRPPTYQGLGTSDYGGLYGERIMSPNAPPKGIMLIDQPVAARDVTDGLAHTIVVGEDTRFPDGQWINGRNLFDQAFPLGQSPPFENDLRSEHPGGVNVLFADGHARLLLYGIKPSVLAALCTRAGNEAVSGVEE